MTDVCNFADDTTFFAFDSNLKDLMQRLEHDAKLAIEWFESNYMKLNEDKCHPPVAGHRHETLWANIGDTRIWESKNEKLLGVVIDRNLNLMIMFLLYVRKQEESYQPSLEFQII